MNSRDYMTLGLVSTEFFALVVQIVLVFVEPRPEWMPIDIYVALYKATPFLWVAALAQLLIIAWAAKGSDGSIISLRFVWYAILAAILTGNAVLAFVAWGSYLS
jgi:hypothetical protein